jgi:DNA-binding LacI/PurR family transcriptional regulator
MKTKRLKVTLSDIAKECGVSLMTVSRALKRDESVATETRERIMDIAANLGYEVRGRLSNISRAKADSVGRKTFEVIVSSTYTEQPWYYAAVIMSLEQELSLRGGELLVRTYSADYENVVHLSSLLRDSTATGTFLLGDIEHEHLKSFLEIVPDAVLLDNPGYGLKCSSIVFDNAEAARMAVSHFVESGRRDILLIKGKREHYFSQDIERGYTEALESAGINVKKAYICESDFTADKTYELVEQLLDSGKTFDAVFTNDQMACGVLRSLMLRGINVPEDVAVIGCDGLPVCTQVIPTLSTLVLNYAELSKEAVEYLFAMEKGQRKVQKIKLMPELVLRQSC